MMTRANLLSDGDGHDYLIPHYRTAEFYSLLDNAQGSDDWLDFEEEFGQYLVEGDFEIYAEFKEEE